MSDEHELANDWTTGFTPRKVGDSPEPKQPKPRCSVEGCNRVVYKSVVCRKHWNEVPIEIRLKRMSAALIAQQVAKADTDLEIRDWAHDRA
jgi:hypothetical protein